MDKQIKIVGKHRTGCHALALEKKGEWDTCWGPLAYGSYGAPVATTERRYGKKGRAFKYWLRFVCNDAQCKAELHVEADFILSAATAKLRRDDGGNAR